MRTATAAAVCAFVWLGADDTTRTELCRSPAAKSTVPDPMYHPDPSSSGMGVGSTPKRFSGTKVLRGAVPREPTATSIDQPCSFAHWHTLSPTPDVGPELTTGPPRNPAASSFDSREQESIAVRLLGVVEGPATVFFAAVAVVVCVVAVAVSVAVATVVAVDFAAEPELAAPPPHPAITNTNNHTSADIGSSLRIRILPDLPGWTIEISIVLLA
jgi:hypothetical protein